jgi:hypothetical protein
MTDTVLAQLAALKHAPASALKVKWRALFDTEPPPYNRRFLESRLAYRIQELAYGGLKAATVERLRVLAKQYDGKPSARRSIRSDNLPITGTRLIREWQGVEHCVTVRGDGFEYEGRPYKSLSAIAREITKTRWNGWVFFGLKSGRGTA